MMVPIWTIVIIVVLILVLITFAFFFFRRRMTRSISVDTIYKKEEEFITKKSVSLASFQTLVTQQQQKQISMKSNGSNNNSFIATTPLPLPPLPNIKKQQQVEETVSSSPHINNNEKTDKPASLFDESEYSYSPPEPPQEIKISLPLPPPSTSFFSDKMELDGDNSQDLYDMYISTKNIEGNNGSGFISIDLDTSSTAVPSFYSNAASNIQQKAATIKSSLYQSIRSKRKSINGGKSSAQQLFSNTTTNEEQSKKLGDSYGYQPTNNIKNSSAITTDSNKIIINMKGVINNTKKQPLNIINNNNDTVEMDDELSITPNPNLQEPIRAAKRVLRSASRKTKTCSMVIDDKGFYPMNSERADDDQILFGGEKDGKRSKHGSIRFASFRGSRSSGEHMTITSGSMKRLVRESILFDDDASLPSIPVASSAAIASTTNSTSRKSGISVVDIASWWESNNDNTPKNLNSTNEGDDSNNSLPLYQNISTGSNSSSNPPHQYRASLSTSIFGTLSKSGGSSATLLNEANKDEVNPTSSALRHNSFRRGTLSRNTFRNITASATNGVNRSIKGLFDHSSSSINKIVPDDSQKMELDSEPIQIAIVEKLTVNSQQQEQEQKKYNSIRQKSIRSSTNTRPSLPLAYLPTSESSTKYALSDEEYILDESSEKTAVDENKNISVTENKKNFSPTEKNDDKYRRKVELPESSFSADMASSTNNGEVDIIRRMLQDTWIDNMRESGSMLSISSDTDSIATTSTGTSKLNPRQQNQSLLTKSLLTQQVAKRASLLARTNINSDNIEFFSQQEPQPSASFSSSTVRTMVPENSNSANNGSGPNNTRQNAINSNTSHSNNNGSNKIQEYLYDEKSSAPSNPSVLLSRLSSSPMDNTSSSPRNSSAESSRGHSRKSSGGNSAATALRISSGYSANAKTWNGRAQKRSSRPSVTRLLNDDDNTNSTPDSPTTFVSISESQHHSIGKVSVNKRSFFSTMRKGQKNRGSIPWMMAEDDVEERTPAQIERDRYLEGKI